MFRSALRVSIPILVFAVALPAIAGEGRIPIWQPTNIAAPGKYIVTRDINGPGPVIDIGSPDVDLDINGFTISETGGAGAVIEISGDLVDVVIRNGRLSGGSESIDRDNSSGQVGDRVVIEDIQSFNPGGTAIHLWSIREVVIRRVNVIDPGGHGIELDRTGSSGFTNGMIEHCTIRSGTGASWDGIHVDNGSAFAVRHNRIETPSQHGIHLRDSYACLVGENTISDADWNGIFLENTQGTKVYNNVVSRGEWNGIVVDPGSGDNLLLENLVRQSGWGGSPTPGAGGGHGILVQGLRNNLEGNTANENDACGFRFDGLDNTFGKNLARNNDPSLPPVGWCDPVAAGGPCVALPAPDYCDTAPAVSGNDTRGDNMASNPVGPF